MRLNGLWYWLPAISVMALIFWMSSWPVAEFFQPLDWRLLGFKFLHMTEYGILALTYLFALQKTSPLAPRACFTTAILLTILYGITDEIHQVFTPLRSPQLIDIFSDGLGAAMFCGMASIVGWKTRT